MHTDNALNSATVVSNTHTGALRTKHGIDRNDTLGYGVGPAAEDGERCCRTRTAPTSRKRRKLSGEAAVG
jgi:hypothetical protein